MCVSVLGAGCTDVAGVYDRCPGGTVEGEGDGEAPRLLQRIVVWGDTDSEEGETTLALWYEDGSQCVEGPTWEWAQKGLGVLPEAAAFLENSKELEGGKGAQEEEEEEEEEAATATGGQQAQQGRVDVTGGLMGKVRCGVEMVRTGGVPVCIASLDSDAAHDLLTGRVCGVEALRGPCTLILRGDKDPQSAM